MPSRSFIDLNLNIFSAHNINRCQESEALIDRNVRHSNYSVELYQ
jgi:hypothetical protein